MSSDDPAYTRPSASIAAYGNSSGNSSSSSGNNMRLTRAAAAQMATLTHAQLASACQGSRLSGLPKFVIYNILEFLVSSPPLFYTSVGAAKVLDYSKCVILTFTYCTALGLVRGMLSR
jgi:hypothetical protein